MGLSPKAWVILPFFRELPQFPTEFPIIRCVTKHLGSYFSLPLCMFVETRPLSLQTLRFGFIDPWENE